jgi:hypothetical protein
VVNLNDYKIFFTNDPAVTLSFHATQADANSGTNGLPAVQNLGMAECCVYVRFTSANACPIVGKLTLSLNQPKESTVLQDKTICDNANTTLDAERDLPLIYGVLALLHKLFRWE